MLLSLLMTLSASAEPTKMELLREVPGQLQVSESDTIGVVPDDDAADRVSVSTIVLQAGASKAGAVSLLLFRGGRGKDTVEIDQDEIPTLCSALDAMAASDAEIMRIRTRSGALFAVLRGEANLLLGPPGGVVGIPKEHIPLLAATLREAYKRLPTKTK